MSWEEIIERFESYMKLLNYSDETAKAYRNDVQWLTKEFSIKNPDDIKKLSGDGVQQHLSLAPLEYATQRRRVAGLLTFFSYLEKEEHLPCSILLQYPKKDNNTEPLQHVISKKEYKKMRKVIFPHNTIRNLAILDVMYGSGLPISITHNLDWMNVSLEERVLKDLEGYSCDIPLSKESQESLYKYIKENPINNSNALFLNRFKERITTRGIRKIIKIFGESIGIEAAPSALRWGFFVNRMDEGRELEEIISLMGYETLHTDAYRSQIRKLYQRIKAHYA